MPQLLLGGGGSRRCRPRAHGEARGGPPALGPEQSPSRRSDAGSHVRAAQIPGPLPSPPGRGDTQIRARPAGGGGRAAARARSCALGLFGSHAALQLRSRTVAFRGDLFGAGSDLEIEFPAAWEANSSHLRLVAGARGGRRRRCDMKVKAAA